MGRNFQALEFWVYASTVEAFTIVLLLYLLYYITIVITKTIQDKIFKKSNTWNRPKRIKQSALVIHTTTPLTGTSH